MYLTDTTRNAAGLLKRLDVPVPAPIVDHQAVLAALLKVLESTQTTVDDFGDFIENSTDPRAVAKAFIGAVDAKVRQDAAANTAATAQGHLARAGNRALARSAPLVAAALQERFDAAAAELAAAIDVVGAEPDTLAVRTLGPAAAANLGTFNRACDQLDTIRAVWSEMLDKLGEPVPLPKERWIDTTRLTAAQMDRIQYVANTGRLWPELLANGYQLAMTDSSAAAAAHQRIADERTAAEQAAHLARTRDAREAGQFEVSVDRKSVV